MTEQKPREFVGIEEYIKRCSIDPDVRATSKVSESDWASFVRLCMVDLMASDEHDGPYTELLEGK